MNEAIIYQKLNQVFQNYFKNKDILLVPSTTADDIQDWDSFSHMELMTKVEEAFEIHIPFDEMMEFATVGDMAQFLIKAKKSIGAQ